MSLFKLTAVDIVKYLKEGKYTCEEIANEIKKHIPEFTIDYKPDFRQKIADSWPKSIDDSEARKQWNWNHEFDLKKMVEVMLNELKKKI